MADIAIIGAGYVGLVAAAGLASLGHRAACVECEPARLRTLQRGESPIFEPGLAELIAENRTRLYFTGDVRRAVELAEFVFLCVQTPTLPSGCVDTSYAERAISAALPCLRRRALLVIKSTVPVGFGDELAYRLALAGRRDAAVVSNPEFLRQGSAVQDFLAPERIVLGGEAPAVQRVAALYRPVRRPVIRCSRRSAELAKYAANALLAMRLSAINEIAAIAGALDADAAEVAAAAGTDPRIGQGYLTPGLGWGGSCFPKDVPALARMAEMAGCGHALLDATIDVNKSQRERAAAAVLAAAYQLPGAPVCILGLSFKEGTGDIRESPAIDVARRLLAAGLRVHGHDPLAGPATQAALPALRIFADPHEATRGCATILLASAWPQYRALDWGRIARAMAGRTVIDGRRALPRAALDAAGLELRYLETAVESLSGVAGTAAGAAGGR